MVATFGDPAGPNQDGPAVPRAYGIGLPTRWHNRTTARVADDGGVGYPIGLPAIRYRLFVPLGCPQDSHFAIATMPSLFPADRDRRRRACRRVASVCRLRVALARTRGGGACAPPLGPCSGVGTGVRDDGHRPDCGRRRCHRCCRRRGPRRKRPPPELRNHRTASASHLACCCCGRQPGTARSP
jgi:hypothetical protein